MYFSFLQMEKLREIKILQEAHSQQDRYWGSSLLGEAETTDCDQGTHFTLDEISTWLHCLLVYAPMCKPAFLVLKSCFTTSQ